MNKNGDTHVPEAATRRAFHPETLRTVGQLGRIRTRLAALPADAFGQ